MSNNLSTIKKGVFAVATVAVIGSSTAAFAVTNQNSTNNNAVAQSGYGVDGDKQLAALDTFNSGLNASTLTFAQKVAAISNTAKSQLGANGGQNVDVFVAKFDSASVNYVNNVNSAEANFRTAVAAAANKAQTKDQFIDAFNRAKAEYFNQLEQAKNDFAAVVSNLGNNANVAKDTFMNGFNSAKDQYGNEVEALKNQLAATLG